MFQKSTLAVGALVLGFSSASFAASRVNCYNRSTNAAMFILNDASTRQTYFEMNEDLLILLRKQGAKPLDRGVGSANWNPNRFDFREFNGVIKVVSDNGGIKLNYEKVYPRYYQPTERANFYFNPGECIFK